jgi:acyl-coenzyme A thioesterase PaaI-like protein
MDKSFQDYYDDNFSHCYGCGRLNDHGLHIKSYWEGDESVCRFTPAPHQTAFPGFVYGGLIASLIDCHAMGTAAAGTYKEENRSMDSEPNVRYVTGSLKVDYLKPTPIGVELEIRASVREIQGRKTFVDVTLAAGDEVCARGDVLAVRLPDDWGG